MNARSKFCIIASVFVLLLGSVQAGEGATAPASSAKPKPGKPAKPALEKGMSAEEIIKAIGKPQEIKPMPVPEGTTIKAEMWIYRRDGGTRAVQVPVGTREVASFVGAGQAASEQHTTEIVYGMKTIKIETVTSLLMYDGKLALARQRQEVSEKY